MPPLAGSGTLCEKGKRLQYFRECYVVRGMRIIDQDPKELETVVFPNTLYSPGSKF